MQNNQTRVRINLNDEQYDQLEKIAKRYKLSIDDLLDRYIKRCIADRLMPWYFIFDCTGFVVVVVLSFTRAIFFDFFCSYSLQYVILIEQHNNNGQQQWTNDNEQTELIEFLDEVLAQKPPTDDELDAMYEQHLNDNNNQ